MHSQKKAKDYPSRVYSRCCSYGITAFVDCFSTAIILITTVTLIAAVDFLSAGRFSTVLLKRNFNQYSTEMETIKSQ